MNQVSVLELFRRAVERVPDGVAMERPDRQVTYRELDSASNRLANYLLSRGCLQGSLVAVLMADSIEIVTALLGILKAGCVYIPFEPLLPRQRLRTLWAQAPADWLLVESPFVGLARELAGSAAIVCVDDQTGEYGRYDESAPVLVPTAPDDLCYIFFTSGSTGVPKGIAGRRKGVDHFIQWETELLHAGDGRRVSQLTSPAFDAFLRDVFLPLANGGTLCIPPSREALLDSGQLLRWLDEQAVQVIHCVPTLFRTLLGHGVPPGSLPHLEHVLLSGEAVTPADVKGWLTNFGERVQLINLYGPSETTMTKFFYVVDPGDADRRVVPIGKPMPGAKALIVDERDKVCPPERIGEILIRTPYMSLGYYGQPELTQKVFIPNPFSDDPEDLVYRTGDLGRVLANGNFELLGRRDLQVKIRGVRVEIGEIESLLRGQPGVSDAAVVSRPGPDGNALLCAFVASSEKLSVDVLRSVLWEHLPEAMIPSIFVLVDELPRTFSGKVDRSVLARRALEPQQPTAGSEMERAKSPAEEILAQIWSEVLGVRQVGLHDNFFAVGGHSVLAAQVLARVRAAFEVEVPLRSFFEAQTLAALARRIEEAKYSGRKLAPPLIRVSREQALPLSFAQERLWFLDQLTPGSLAYHMTEEVLIEGALRAETLARAFVELVRRHEVLRTSFPFSAGQPVQVISPVAPVDLPLIDLSALPRPLAERGMIEAGSAFTGRPFDLEQGPLLRFTLVRLATERHRLLLALHHITSDAWSMDLLVSEVASLYRALHAGEPSPLPELPLQYADYSFWQRQWFREEALEEQLAFWRQQLADVPPSLELPTDRLRPAIPSERGGHLPWALPEPLYEGLKSLGRQSNGTLFMGVLAAWSALLFRLTAQTDLCIGTPISGRDHLETERLIGFFVNMLVLRIRLAPSAGFRQAIVHTREVALAAFSHRDLPFARLVEALQPQRSLQLTPFFQALLVLHNAPRQPVEIGGLALRSVGAPEQSVRFDLTLRLIESHKGLAGSFDYAAELFDATTLARWAGHFETLLQGALAEPERSLAELPLLAPAQCRQLLSEWNDTRTAAIPPVCIHELIADQAARTPEAVAVLSEERSLTYRELEQQADHLSRRLRKLGVGPETLVALCLERSPEALVGMLAVLKAGGAYLPLDPQSPRERLLSMLEDVPVRWALTRSAYRGLFAERAMELLLLDETLAGPEEESALPSSGVTPRNLAYVICTSGSTGRPKAVGVEHRSLVNYVLDAIEWMRPKPGASSILAQPLTFDSCVTAIYPPLLTGGLLHVISAEDSVDAHALAKTFDRRPAGGLKIAPSHMAALHSAMPDGSLLPSDWLMVGGEIARFDWLRELQAAAPHCLILNEYGPTEATVGILLERFSEHSGVDFSEGALVGRPMANTAAYLLDPQMRPVAPGALGTLFIGGDCLARGYLGRPDLTALRFLPDPYGGEPGARLYDTGDLMRQKVTGALVFYGRIDHQVKVRGFRIELGEVEAAVRRHPAVREAVVRVWSETPSSQALVAFIVPRGNGPAPDAGDLRRFLADKLPDYMHPSALVVLDALPRNPHGKLDLKALPMPTAVGEKGTPNLPPRTPVEEMLVGLWAEALGRNSVGLDDDFFALGGHSLLATRLVAAVRAACEVEISVRDLFEAPTPLALTMLVERARSNGHGLKLPPIVPVPRGRELPLSFDQRRLWFLAQLEPGNPFYNRSDAVRCTGPLDLPVLERCFDELVRRHEILRTIFPAREGHPVQVVTPPASLGLTRVDLAGLPESRREEEARRLTAAELRIPFDLSRGPLLRVRVFRLSAEEHIVGLCMHHIIWDGGSTGVLVRDLVAMYRAFATGQPSPLAPLPLQYADFACWQQEHLAGELLEEQLAYWRRQLADVLPRMALAVDRPRPAIPSYRGSDVPIDLPADLVTELRALSRRCSATLFMTLLAAFDVLLYAHSGSTDVVVSVPAGNRGRPELEPLIGFFVNMLALRTRLSGEIRFTELIGQVRKTSLDALDHMQVPFDRVVNSLRLPRDLGYGTLTQVSFVLGVAAAERVEVPGLVWSRMAVERGTVQYELNLGLVDTGGGLGGVLEYSTELFDRSTAVRMARDYELILRAVVERPEVLLSDLEEMLADTGRQELVTAGLRHLQRARRRVAAAPERATQEIGHGS